MENLRKKIRFLFWVSLEFLKKNLLWVGLGFVVFFVGIIFLVLFKPLFLRLVLGKVERIGIVGNYTYNNPPYEILEKISRPILTIDKKGNVVPVLLTQWEVKNSGKTFRFYFRKDLVWNDGQPFSVKDIAGSLFKDAKLRIIDDYTLEVELQNPTIILPYYLRRPIYRYPLVGIGGEYEVTKVDLREGNFQEVVLSSKITGEVVVYRFYNNEAQMANAFKVGKIDRLEFTDKDLVNEFKRWRNAKVYEEVDYQYMAVVFFNLKNKILAEKGFREGISYIIPWDKLSEKGELSKGPIPPNSDFYASDLPSNVYDEEKGLELIKEVVKEETIDMVVKTDYRLTDLAEYIAERLNNIGIRADVEVMVSEEDLDEGFDIAVVFWKIPLAVDQYFFWHSTQTDAGNKTNYKNLRVDKYLEDARSTFSFEKQFIALKKFQEEIVRDKPAIFLYFPYRYIIERKKLF